MAAYRVTNLKDWSITLPPPLSWKLNAHEVMQFSTPPMTTAAFNLKYAALVSMFHCNTISLVPVADPGIVVTPGAGDIDQFISVATKVQRDAIPPANRTPGMLVYCYDERSFWTLSNDLLVWFHPEYDKLYNKETIITYLGNGDIGSIETTGAFPRLSVISYLGNGDVDKIETAVGSELKTDQLNYTGSDLTSITTTIVGA